MTCILLFVCAETEGEIPENDMVKVIASINVGTLELSILVLFAKKAG